MGSQSKRGEEPGWPSTAAAEGSRKAEEIMTEKIFFLFPMQSWGEARLQLGTMCWTKLEGIAHSFPCLSFPICWVYALHSLTAQQHRLCSIPHHHGTVQVRGMGKKWCQGRWKTGIPQNSSSSPPAQERVHVPRGQAGSQPHRHFPQDESQKLWTCPFSRGTEVLAHLHLAAWHSEKETVNTVASRAQSWGWGKCPLHHWHRRANAFLPLAQNPTGPFWAGLCTGGK